MKRRLNVMPASPAPLTAERLFREQFLPFYPQDPSLDVIRRTDANPGGNPAIVQAIEETARVFAALAPEALARPDLALDGSDASIHHLSAALTPETRDRLFASRPVEGQPSLFVQFVLHAALYVGACAVRNHGGRWLVRNPLWETRVALESKAGTSEICPFSFLLRALSDEAAERPAGATLADRYRAHVEVPFEDADHWPIIAPPDRRIPRLARVRYDLLYRHLQTHLPELDDFGADFPSAERFTELGFQWLEFLLVGEGRALVMHGPATTTGRGKQGVHVFWLTKAGFTKALFFETDAGRESHRVTLGRASNGTETVVVSRFDGGRSVEDEMLWWGR
ncbi:MAG: hypothetical protein HOW73_20890 [Polyangiaceae bacterium]|nr:hypothetical protein [Polyangiaceae bacterium]